MEKRIIECVPNFSEGRDMAVIKQITDIIQSVEGIKLLDVDPGKDTNRTVVTFVGDPVKVCEAAFLAVKKASMIIDMSKHHGEHPRMGATDVLPLIPVSGITMKETAELARMLGKRIGEELRIPVYCYENAAFTEKRRNLAHCREGEYEGLMKKLADPEWRPDFGPAEFNAKSGATAVGARDFLVAFNINLNTTSTRRANAIAFDVREKGRDIINEKGERINIPGTLKSVKAIGWYIEEYGIAQISMNLTNISVTPVHIAFDEVCRKADARGIRVTGSELVGLIPLNSMLEAGRYYLKKQQRSCGVSDDELIHIAIKSMGLSEIHEFKPEEKIIEFVMADKEKARLTDLSLKKFMEVTASESPAPGGGSVAAYIGTIGSALGTMVANLSSHKRGWDDRWEEFSDWAVKGKEIQNSLLALVDEDTEAFNRVMEAYAHPGKSSEEKAFRNKAIQESMKMAALVPLRVMRKASEAFNLIRAMVETGNPNSVTDAGVGALAIGTCIKGAFINVKVNLLSVEDKEFASELKSEAEKIWKSAETEENEILQLVEDKINK
jgi:glutamate formiminotransferase / formiminotetrahydrofolate cyclodeaminase